MPVEVKDVDGGLGNIIVYRGVVTKEEYLDALIKHLTQDKEKFKQYRYSLNDAMAISEITLSVEEISLVANYCKSAASVNKNAIVATVVKQDFVYGLARMSDLLRDETGWKSEVFRNMNEAKAWIRKMVSERFGIKDLTFT